MVKSLRILNNAALCLVCVTSGVLLFAASTAFGKAIVGISLSFLLLDFVVICLLWPVFLFSYGIRVYKLFLVQNTTTIT